MSSRRDTIEGGTDVLSNLLDDSDPSIMIGENQKKKTPSRRLTANPADMESLLDDLQNCIPSPGLNKSRMSIQSRTSSARSLSVKASSTKKSKSQKRDLRRLTADVTDINSIFRELDESKGSTSMELIDSTESTLAATKSNRRMTVDAAALEDMINDIDESLNETSMASSIFRPDLKNLFLLFLQFRR